jgi:hypothetical protein
MYPSNKEECSGGPVHSLFLEGLGVPVPTETLYALSYAYSP